MSKKENSSDGLFTVTCKCGTVFPAENGCCTSCQKTQGELKLDVDKMLSKMYELNAAGETDATIDVVFDVYWNLHRMFDVMNEITGKVDVSKLDTSVLISLLTQTFKYIKEVPNHLVLCNKVEAKLREIGEPEYPEKRIHDLIDRYRTTGNYWQDMEALGAPEWLSGAKPE